MEHGVVGITTNPTILAKAIESGSSYENQVRDLVLRSTAVGETLRLLPAADGRAACDILRPVGVPVDQRWITMLISIATHWLLT